MRFSRLFCVALLLGSWCGCAKDEKIVAHPVSGVVNYDGKAAAGVKVYLIPTSAPMVPQIPTNPHGQTDASGRFTLTTFGNNDGAAEGGYQIVLFWPPELKEGQEGNDEDRLLGWYTAARSTLTFHVKAGDNTIPTLNLPLKTTKPPESAGIPGRN
mgnify:CR=1 FL=1